MNANRNEMSFFLFKIDDFLKDSIQCWQVCNKADTYAHRWLGM